MPAPASLAQQLARANAALPAGVEIAPGRGRRAGYLVKEHGIPAARAESLVAAIFIAQRRARFTPPPSEASSHG